MHLYLAVTDNNWFRFLSERKPDEINFWQPGGKTAFGAIPPGAPFLFKLHSPYNYVVGGGFFLRHFFLPVSLAWDAFKENNGTPDYHSFCNQIRKYRAKSGKVEIDPVIGCIILANPFFFAESDWIPVPADWKPSIVQGKTYDTQDLMGRSLWNQVAARLDNASRPGMADAAQTSEEPARYGAEYLARPRLGQGAFRVLVTEAYGRRCAMTGEKTLPVLNASHIKPYSQQGPHEVSNGLLLREDIHTLFDRGYLTITSDYHIEVSRRIKEDYGNGREYYALHGRELLILPERPDERPTADFIRWHNEKVYVS